MPRRPRAALRRPLHTPGLDPELCERARQTRDARFDGRFFVGVLTTGVYCRPICGVRLPKPENVRFFASAAAAADAGFRPCLRCRPESSPGTSAWRGTAATVSRALRLIQAGALDEADVGALAGRLGIGARQLSRLFVRHLGAAPLQVAQTRRLHLAKKLLDETGLPITRIAGAAGFGSVRRFNEAIRATYGRAPSALRRARPLSAAGERLELRVAFRPPFDWPALRDFLAQRAVPGVEQVEGDRYRRTIAVDGRLGRIEARALPGSHQLALSLELPDAASALVRVLARVRRLFDLDAAPATLEADLGRDAQLAVQLAKRPGLRVPGAFDPFELAVRAILGQLVSVATARNLAARLAARFGRRVPGASEESGTWLAFPDAATLAEADLRGSGLPEARAAAIRGLARGVAAGSLDLESPRGLDDFVAELCELPGIGAWTAHYVALRALGEPDAFPASDLGLLRGAALCLGSGEPFTAARLARRAEAWRPWRGYAAMHLWSAYADAAARAPRRARS
jgi:AraC family transcriptional regulator of adaptative response / DNA-3-methyladenine glycosylase II